MLTLLQYRRQGQWPRMQPAAKVKMNVVVRGRTGILPCQKLRALARTLRGKCCLLLCSWNWAMMGVTPQGQSTGGQLRTNGSQPGHCISQWEHPLPPGTGWGLTRIRGTGPLSQMLTLLELEVGAVKGPEEVLTVCRRSKFHRPNPANIRTQRKLCTSQNLVACLHWLSLLISSWPTILPNDPPLYLPGTAPSVGLQIFPGVPQSEPRRRLSLTIVPQARHLVVNEESDLVPLVLV